MGDARCHWNIRSYDFIILKKEKLHENTAHKDIGATHEMIPMHCPSTPLQEASLSFHPWPAHQNPRAFLLAEATNKLYIFSKH